MSALDLNGLPNLMNSFNTFAFQLQNENQQLVAEARAYTQSYTSLFGREVPPSYLDLGHFVLLMRANTKDERTIQAADAVLAGLRSTVLVEKHGDNRKGSTGLAMYFPNSTLYSSAVAGPQSYTGIANRFAGESLWDDFMAFHYTDRSFEPVLTQPYSPSGSFSPRAGAGTDHALEHAGSRVRPTSIRR
jgi:hypothetical protein